jgi:hypothetical protein
MPKPRKISTKKRAAALKKVQSVVKKEAARVKAIIADLSKEHVDDKVKAKALIKAATKVHGSLDRMYP